MAGRDTNSDSRWHRFDKAEEKRGPHLEKTTIGDGLGIAQRGIDLSGGRKEWIEQVVAYALAQGWQDALNEELNEGVQSAKEAIAAWQASR